MNDAFALRLVQLRDAHDRRAVAAITAPGEAAQVISAETVLSLAQEAIDFGESLAHRVAAHGLGVAIDIAAAEREGRLLPPIDHPDPAHCYVTGTGLTHLGSAEGRDRMHRDYAEAAHQTDSMRMFLLGVEGGRPAPSETGVQPEWFYKGDGSILVGAGQQLPYPDFALDAGEEPEICGLYLIDRDGRPRRLGFALANEFSDHVMEQQNYLYLAHSKLRHASIGPELLSGPLPRNICGISSIVREGATIWSKPFLSGEDNMSHSIANLEDHHFKNPLFRRPGDVHIHFFGTATLSFSDGISTRPDDVLTIAAAPFSLPLRNRIRPVSCTRLTVSAL